MMEVFSWLTKLVTNALAAATALPTARWRLFPRTALSIKSILKSASDAAPALPAAPWKLSARNNLTSKKRAAKAALFSCPLFYIDI